MSVGNLDRLFAPRSIAVIGASRRARSVGAVLTRIVGPNCVGVMVPPHGLNASFVHVPPLPGDIGFTREADSDEPGVMRVSIRLRDNPGG